MERCCRVTIVSLVGLLLVLYSCTCSCRLELSFVVDSICEQSLVYSASTSSRRPFVSQATRVLESLFRNGSASGLCSSLEGISLKGEEDDKCDNDGDGRTSLGIHEGVIGISPSPAALATGVCCGSCSGSLSLPKDSCCMQVEMETSRTGVLGRWRGTAGATFELERDVVIHVGYILSVRLLRRRNLLATRGKSLCV